MDAGSPFSTSEPSIEPEGPSSGGAEDNYHRNMSWLHVCVSLWVGGWMVLPSGSDLSSLSADHDPAVQPAELHLHPHRLLPPTLLPAPQPLLRPSGPRHQAGVRRDGGQPEGGQRLLREHRGARQKKQRGSFQAVITVSHFKRLLFLFSMGGSWESLCLQCSDKSCLRTPSMKRRPTDSNTEGKKDTGMLKYIRNQVSWLFRHPVSL